MKRAAVMCVLVGLVAGALVAPAGAANSKPKRVTRSAEATYDLPYLISPSLAGGGCFHAGGIGNPCPVFMLEKGEQWVTMEVHDASGTPAAFKIWQKKDPNDLSSSTMGGPFCGTTGNEPVRLAPGVEVGVSVFAFGDVICPGGFATTGTVTAVFSNVP